MDEVNTQDYRRAVALIKNRLPADLARARGERGIGLVLAGEQAGIAASTFWRAERGGDVGRYCLLALMEWIANG